MKTVFIIDDHTLFINGMKALIESFQDFSFVGSTTTVQGIEEKLLQTSPHIVLLDLNLGGVDGLDYIQVIKKRLPSVKVLIITMYEEQSLIKKARRLGADGLLLKNSDEIVLEMALNALAQNDECWDYAQSKKKRVVQKEKNDYADDYQRINNLTRRETDVFLLLAKSYSTKEIASELDMSENTVSTHRKHIKKKLNIRSTSDIVKIAFEKGLL